MTNKEIIKLLNTPEDIKENIFEKRHGSYTLKLVNYQPIADKYEIDITGLNDEEIKSAIIEAQEAKENDI